MRKTAKIFKYAVLILGAAIMLVPFIWMILTAFKTTTEATQMNPFIIFPSEWKADAFIDVSRKIDFIRLYINTILMIAGRIFCAVATACMAGYAFGRLKFKGKNFWFSLVLFQMMVPGQIFVIPQYLMLSKINMLNTIFSLIFPGLVTAFGTFLMRQAFLRGNPHFLFEHMREPGAVYADVVYDIVYLNPAVVIKLDILNRIFHVGFAGIIVVGVRAVRTCGFD